MSTNIKRLGEEDTVLYTSKARLRPLILLCAMLHWWIDQLFLLEMPGKIMQSCEA